MLLFTRNKKGMSLLKAIVFVIAIIIVIAVIYRMIIPPPPSPTPPSPTIAGKVTDAKTGSPLAGAAVTANGYEATTGPEGVYSMSVEVGDYTLTVTMEGYTTETASVSVSKKKTYTVNVSLPPVPPLQKPTAVASAAPAKVRLGEDISFSAEGSRDPDGHIVKYVWIFGDGQEASGNLVVHRYEHPGDYTVTLTVTDDSGLSDTTTLTVNVVIPKYTLSEVIENKYAEVEITGMRGLLGRGICAGDSILVQLKRLTPYVIEVKVPRGTLLLASGEEQNMVVVKVTGIPTDEFFYKPTSKIVLDTIDIVKYILRAYCVDFHKPNPNQDTLFSLGGSADPEVLKVLNVLDELPSNVTTVEAVQTAIFVVTDNVSREELQERFPVEPEDIENAKVILEAAGIDVSSKELFASP